MNDPFLCPPPANVSDVTDDAYRQLVEAITDYAIYMLDPNGYVASWNAGAQRFKGYQPDEVIGSHFSRFYTQEDQEAGIPAYALRTSAETGKFEAEGWRVRKDGECFWAHVVIDPIRDPSGRLVGFAKITRDLTERRAAEEALRASQEQFRLLVHGVTDYAIYMIDPQGSVSSWNEGARRIKGYEPHEIIGEHFSRFYSEDDRNAGLPEGALETARSEGRFAAEGWRIRKDGGRFRASVVIDAIRDDAGALIGFAKITRDVTERDEAQQQLEKAREALFQSQKLEAIGQLTGGIAHDFNNLLMAIQSSLTLLRKRMPHDALAHRLLDNAFEGAQRGATLTQRMLAFARRQELQVDRIELPRLLSGMSDLVQRSIGPEWPIEMSLPMALPAVSADANQLEMAVLNLVVNARDATSEGGPIIVKATQHNGTGLPSGLVSGQYVCLSVTDCGAGMDADTLRRATEPFYTTKGIGKGTGLGLPMVHGFAEQIGGAFVLKSQVGEGTTAEIWLPVAERTEAAAPAPALDPEAAAVVEALTILAVDDDTLVLMNTSALLEDLGHKVIEADSGAEALEKLATQRIDLVITDQAMPNMTGVELIEKIGVLQPGVPAIIASGYGEGVDAYDLDVIRLSKPFSQVHLARAVAQATLHRQRAEPAQSSDTSSLTQQ